jgi:hypothetical protein
MTIIKQFALVTHLALAAIFVLGISSSAAAQSGSGITSHNFRQYLVGATTPVTTPFNFLDTAVTCNLLNPITTPHAIAWDDPNDLATPPTHSCVWVDSGTGPLFAKIYGALVATLTNIAGTGAAALESAESNQAPFSKIPPAPTGHRVNR